MVSRGGGGTPQVTLSDDRGTIAKIGYSGVGSGSTWKGKFQSEGPLAFDTAWLEVLGERIEMTHEARPAAVRVERVPDEDPALRHLWHRVATLGLRPSWPEPLDALRRTIETLVAAGCLAADAPDLEDVRRVAALLIPPVAPTADFRALPLPWRALLDGLGRTNGPRGTVPVGTATPAIDGAFVAVMQLTSKPAGFVADVAVRGLRLPGHILPGHMRDLSALQSLGDGRWLEWWATDDRGNTYLGHLNAAASEHQLDGEVRFWPALDPRATRLDLIPTGPTSRAVITVPLQWEPSR